MRRFVLPVAFCMLSGMTAAAETGAEKAHAFLGTAKCKACHIRQARSWSATKMGRAFELLKPGVARDIKIRSRLDPEKDYTAEKVCLPCHTTGYGKPGGFVEAVKTPEMAGVGCESCHGAGADYARKGMMGDKNYKKAALVEAGLVAEVTMEPCAVCHNDQMAVGTMVGSRHFVKSLVFSKTKDIHEHTPLKGKH